jgi:hypothetical protein
MFKLRRIFKRKQTTSVVFGVFQRLGIFIERQQRKAADYLNVKAARLSRRQLMMGFWIFCIVFGSYAFYIIAQAFYQPARIVQVKAIHIPAHSITSETKEHTDKLLTQREINSIIQFQQYLDSLQQSKTGQLIYDSIVHDRSGLLDSLHLIQQIFSEQLKSSEDGKQK